MRDGLTKTALFILGIIANEPTNPYTMSKLVNFNRRTLRKKIPAQTVFSIIKILSKKGLISGEKVKKGNMPDMTVYSISAKGQKILKQNLMACITSPEDPMTNLVLSLMLICYLDKDEALQALHEYRDKIRVDIATRKHILSMAIKEDTIFTRIISAHHIFNIQRANLETVEELIEDLEANPQCKNFPVPWWREEYLKSEKKSKKTRAIKAAGEAQANSQ
jgi:DNA-binding PadR family transcriptional regulator